jgi:membrane-associated phospholipid phosphatase
MLTSMNRRGLLKLAAVATATVGASSLPAIARQAFATTSARATLGEPGAGAWRTWFLHAGSDLRLPPPPDSVAEVGVVRGMLGNLDEAARDRVAYWDAGPPPYRWNVIATDMFFRGAFGSSNFPRIQAYLNMAIHDATVASWDSKYAYSRPRPNQLDASIVPVVAVPNSPAYPSEHAAAAGAASEVLGYFAPKEAEALRTMADEASTSRVQAGVQYSSDLAAGLDIGRAVAELTLSTVQADNYDAAKWDGVIPEGPGLWKGQNPSGAADRFWKPLIVPSADYFRPPPPPAYNSPERAQEIEAVKNFPRTPATNGIAMWAQYQLRGSSNYNIVFNRELSRRVLEERLDDSPLPARIYALMHAIFLDAWITTQDAKFTYWSARPSMFDPSITTLFPNPNHPSYVSNASAQATSPSLVLAHFFPRDAAAIVKQANEYGDARLWAGIHFPSDVETSRRMGEQLAAMALARDSG